MASPCHPSTSLPASRLFVPVRMLFPIENPPVNLRAAKLIVIPAISLRAVAVLRLIEPSGFLRERRRFARNVKRLLLVVIRSVLLRSGAVTLVHEHGRFGRELAMFREFFERPHNEPVVRAVVHV